MDQDKRDDIETDIGFTQICLGCYNKLRSLPHEDISKKSKNYVDNLPYGVIIIDEANKILTYNRTESQLTGFDPTLMQGKNFFTEVAPCTAVQEFEGKVKEMRREDSPMQDALDFTFNHKNFFAEVSILLTWDPITRNTVISVRKISEEDADDSEPLIDVDEF